MAVQDAVTSLPRPAFDEPVKLASFAFCIANAAFLATMALQGLWLIDPAGVWSAPKSEMARLVLEKGKNPLIPHNEDEFAETFAFVTSDPPFVPRPMLDVLAQTNIHNVRLAENIFLQTVSDSIEERAHTLRIPALIVWGAKDRVISVESAQVLHRLMPNSQVRIMDGLGHLPMIESPRESAKDYLAYRDKLTASG